MNKLEVSIIWNLDDIRSLGYECTDEEGMKVLHTMVKNHDAEYGISWATLDSWCESFKLKLNPKKRTIK